VSIRRCGSRFERPLATLGCGRARPKPVGQAAEMPSQYRAVDPPEKLYIKIGTVGRKSFMGLQEVVRVLLSTESGWKARRSTLSAFLNALGIRRVVLMPNNSKPGHPQDADRFACDCPRAQPQARFDGSASPSYLASVATQKTRVHRGKIFTPLNVYLDNPLKLQKSSKSTHTTSGRAI
jgi:hypothetical protein